MSDPSQHAIAIVGLGCVLPDALDVPQFWRNIIAKRYSITETPPDRWSIADYYDPDPAAPEKTYSKIGGWVRGFDFDWKRYKLPPRVVAAMDVSQQWALTIAEQALTDFGYPQRPLDTERTAVILGTAMGGELHYLTNQRIVFPEVARALTAAPDFAALPAVAQARLLADLRERYCQMAPPISEDTMPGELPNIVSGRVANVFNLRGASFITDAACASALAAVEAACQMLIDHEADAVLTGGVDRNMGASTFVKFCKIGALSATGTRPFGAGADGFVMGEGAAAFLLKRLADAERAGDNIYAVIRGVGGASDGKGKGITAPNPAGQRLAVERAWRAAGLDPASATLVEAHGTSTKVGDVVEVESLSAVFGHARAQSIALGSVKSNIGHLKAGAGAAGLLKAVLAVHHRILPPTLNARAPNPNIPFERTPFYLNHEAQDWPRNGAPRRAAVSAYGFGGTNFHLVLEEHQPGALTQPSRVFAAAVPAGSVDAVSVRAGSEPALTAPIPLRGILVLGAATPAGLKARVDEALARAQTGWQPPLAWPAPADLTAPERVALDFGTPEELTERLLKAQKALGFDSPAAWKALQAQGVFRGSGRAPGKLAFLFPGQGSQYLNMGRDLLRAAPVVAEVFREADAVMTPILGRPLTSYIFVDSADPAALKQGEKDLMQTAITQPAMLTLDIALYRLLEQFGFVPDMVMGHSLGEYAALIAADIMPFAHALEASAARGAEMTKVSVSDNGWMAAVMAPLAVIEATLKDIPGYVVAANLNSHSQAVIGGESAAVARAIEVFTQKGYQAVRLPVSHAFHTRIVAPASRPLRQALNRLTIRPPRRPLVANVTGELYPTDVESIKDILEQQIAAPVQWVKGLQTLYAQGVRAFVEVGPKKALKGFVDDVLGAHADVISLFTNHPKTGELASFNQALCGLLAAGYGAGRPAGEQPAPAEVGLAPTPTAPAAPAPLAKEDPMPSLDALAQLLAQALRPTSSAPSAYDRNLPPAGSVVITGVGLGLPGASKPVMDPDNVQRILRGEQFIDLIPERFRQAMLAKRVTRLVKGEDGGGRFETIENPDEVIKLAGRPGAFDLHAEYGVPEKLIEALDTTTQLAMAAGLDALREAGIPLVQTWKKTSTGKLLPDRWMLPEALRDETGVIFASAFPGGDRFVDEFSRYYAYQNRLSQMAALEDLRLYTQDDGALREINRRLADLREQLAREPYEFDRRFIFRILAMGHSQFAEYVGARGPNTHVNAACASTTQAIALAEDWIRAGRCRRVIVLGADNVTNDTLMEWIGAGFLATGAAATDDRVAEAALPFDRRRHGTILGMGACALVLESEDAVRERGMRGIVELLSSETHNSAFHGTRLDVHHISQVMNDLVTAAERRFGLHRQAIAPQTVFMSHETFTPARGGSASAEVAALRHTFGNSASDIIIANTKGFTGHPMGVGVEDVIAVKILEYGLVPPVPNFKEIDPDLGLLNLSRGGRYPVQYAIHLAAGFGSQIALTFTRRIPGGLNRVDNAGRYQRWLDEVSGYDSAELEVVKRVLRVTSSAPPVRAPVASAWVDGTGPTVRAVAPGLDVATAERPARMVTAPPPADSAQTGAVRADAVRVDAVRAGSEPAPTAPTAPTTPTAPTVPTAPAGADPITEAVLTLVAEKTGYPRDMLDLDLDMEADLGIDTVKQAETFAAIREQFNIPRRDDLRLRDYPTLGKVVQFVRDSRPDLAPAPAPADSVRADAARAGSEPAPPAPPPSFPSRAVAAWGLGLWGVTTPAPTAPTAPTTQPAYTIEDANRVPRRVPAPALRPALEMCASTGVTLDETSRVVVMCDKGGVGKALINRLQKRGVRVLALEDAPATPALSAQLQTWLAEGPITGVYWLPALDVEPPLAEMDIATFRELNRVRVKNLYAAMRILYQAVSAPGTFLISATRLGGLHGYNPEGATAPLGGAVTGFTKAYKRERPEVLVKAVDFEASRKTADPADLLIAETLYDPGAVEIGLSNGLRFGVTLVEEPAGDGQPGLPLTPDTVFVVTGAAGGITSAIVADLAQASRGVFYLLDLTPAPARSDPHIELFRSDKDALKQRLIAEAKSAGERPTPASIEKALLGVERREAALRAIESVEAVGGTAHYFSLDLRDDAAVRAVVADIRQRYGRIDVLLHAGGLEISRALPDKDPAQFDLVFDVKADGFFSLLNAAHDLPLAATVAFSSVAGRFGNNGQTDYSAANDLLCKITSNLRATRPQTRGLVIDWTAWGGIGMATRGSIPKIMEMAGIDMLPPESGIPTIRRELTAGGWKGEIVVGNRLGVLVSEFAPHGGADIAKLNAALPNAPLVERLTDFALYGGYTAQTTLDPAVQPFLYDHALDGTPLLPGVMGAEIFAQLSARLAPGYAVIAVEDEHFDSPFKFYRHQPRTLYLTARLSPAANGDLVAHVTLRSRTPLPAPAGGEPTLQEKQHFRARVRLSAQAPAAPQAAVPALTAPNITRDRLYQVYFHGPAYQVVAEAEIGADRVVARYQPDLPPNSVPPTPTLMAPRLLELCFQAAGLWEMKHKGALALPLSVDSVTAYAQPETAQAPLLAHVAAIEGGASFNAVVVDTTGAVYLTLTGYRTVPLPGQVTL